LVPSLEGLKALRFKSLPERLVPDLELFLDFILTEYFMLQL